ncbi:ferredoxin [Microbacterium sp. P5_E9]
MTMRIELDEPKCVASGLCVMVAPDVFDQRDDDGIAILLESTPAEGALHGVRQAVALCPAAALRLISE